MISKRRIALDVASAVLGCGLAVYIKEQLDDKDAIIANKTELIDIKNRRIKELNEMIGDLDGTIKSQNNIINDLTNKLKEVSKKIGTDKTDKSVDKADKKSSFPTSKQGEVLAWRKAHPNGSRDECVKDTGISKSTVDRWWEG